MSSVSSDSRWTCRHRSSMLQSWHLQLHLLKITCSGKLWGIKFSTLMLKTRTVSAQTDASDNSLMGGSSWASNCNFESECKADYLQSAKMRWSNELKFSVHDTQIFGRSTQMIWTIRYLSTWVCCHPMCQMQFCKPRLLHVAGHLPLIPISTFHLIHQESSRN